MSWYKRITLCIHTGPYHFGDNTSFASLAVLTTATKPSFITRERRESILIPFTTPALAREMLAHTNRELSMSEGAQSHRIDVGYSHKGDIPAAPENAGVGNSGYRIIRWAVL